MIKTLLPRYISREFILNFLLSFFFFFFIFFMNQLLLMLQQENVKDLSFKIIVELILLSTPQFLTYTFPFSSLTSTAMIIGDLSSKNEIVALRSLGISLKRVFIPVLMCAILTSFGTFYIANRVNPWAASQYKNVYANIMHDMPTMALKPNSTTTINNVTISAGDSNGGLIDNIRIIDSSNQREAQLITSKSGKLVDSKDSRYVFSLMLNDPEIMTTNLYEPDKWTLANAKSIIYTLDMTSLLPAFGEPNATQVTNSELLETIKDEKESLDIGKKNDEKTIDESIFDSIVTYNNIINSSNINSSIINMTSYSQSRENIIKRRNKKYYSYRMMYFESEYYKRFVLSFACIVLSFLAFSISFFKVRNGRLIGFALSMFIAVIYWVALYVAQLNSITKFSSSVSVAFKMWIPNILFLVLAFVFFIFLRRR